ncbi:MAG: biopolymer transporter ExbD [bacterium]|nr:biopolymer transporter ExbD [bacterium]
MKLKRSRTVEEIPVASMADIAFLLIIFFMVVAIFSLKEGLSIVLPGLQAKTKVVLKEDLLTIQTNAKGEISIDGKKVMLNEVKNLVKKRFRERKKPFVLFKIHPKCRYEVVVSLLDEVRKANVYNLCLRVIE